MKLSFAIVFTLASFYASAQGLTRQYDSSCDCTVVSNHYDDGSLSSTYQENDNKERHGVEVVYYPGGVKQYERTWKNGKLDGKGTHYHRNGEVYYMEIHNNGIKQGTWTFYDVEGDKVQEITYTGSNNDGTYDYYHADVKYLTQTISNGSMTSETVLNQAIYDQLKAEAEASPKK